MDESQQEALRQLVSAIESFLPEGHVFGLIVFPEAGEGRVQWVCNADHGAALQALRGLVVRMMKARGN